MNTLNAISRTAGDREAGVPCPHCSGMIQAGNPVAICQTCGTAHHQGCWQNAGRCGSYVCAPARRDLASTNGEPALRISAAELAQTAPQPPLTPRVYYAARTPPPPVDPRRTNRLAIAALMCALAALPCFSAVLAPAFAGILIVGLVIGLVAIVLGSFAVGSIRTHRQKGMAVALVGILLGLADMVGCVVGFSFLFLQPEHHILMDFSPDLTALENLDPKISRCMRANVLIESDARGFLGATALGSGVILKRARGETLIITNRHVVDPNFAADAPARAEKHRDQIALKVHLVDRSMREGRVLWIAPDGIDLALVKVEGRCPEARVTKWKLGRERPRVGDPVFAIGNPQGLGWTHTTGTISQYRLQNVAGHQLSVIQTQTAINQGNSGGGLYDNEGYLIGINTWTKDKRFSEGLNFAIALEALSVAPPPMLALKAGSEDSDQP